MSIMVVILKLIYIFIVAITLSLPGILLLTKISISKYLTEASILKFAAIVVPISMVYALFVINVFHYLARV